MALSREGGALPGFDLVGACFFILFISEKETRKWIFRLQEQQADHTAEEAAKLVKSGDWVDYTWCTNHPVALDKALAARQNELEDVKVRGGVTMWMPEIAKADDAGEHFAWHSWHCSGIDRKIIAKGMASSPHALFRAAPVLSGEPDPVDVVFTQVPHGRARQLLLLPGSSPV